MGTGLGSQPSGYGCEPSPEESLARTMPTEASPLGTAAESATARCGGDDGPCFGLHSAADSAGFNPSGVGESSPVLIIGTVIQFILGFVGIVFMLLVLYGGFSWMFAQGNEEKVTKARNLIIHSAVGLVITLSGYLITRVVVDLVLKSASTVS